MCESVNRLAAGGSPVPAAPELRPRVSDQTVDDADEAHSSRPLKKPGGYGASRDVDGPISSRPARMFLLAVVYKLTVPCRPLAVCKALQIGVLRSSVNQHS